MLNRRAFMKTAAAVGLSSIVPLIPQSRASVNNVRPVSPSILAGSAVKDSAESLMAVEQWENLLDDLDCIELVARYTWLTSVAGKRISDSGETLSFYAHCPFCSSNDSIYVREDSYHCRECQSRGSAIDFFMNAEKCSCIQAIAGLQSMLDVGELRGRLPELQQYWRILAETRLFYQEVLCHRREGASAKRWLSEQGIGAGTVERFKLGYAPVQSDGLLQKHLLGQGYSLGAIEATGVTIRNDRGQIKDHNSGMVIPLGDQEGNVYGFCSSPNILGSAPSAANCGMTRTSSFSKRRLGRLIVPAPTWPQDLNKFDEIVMASTAWEVVALHSIGIENAVWMPLSAIRTVFALTKTIIYPCRAQGHTQWTIEELMEHMGPDYQRTKLLALPEGRSLAELLRLQGPEAVRTAMRAAVPLSQALSS